jgi:N-acetyl-gamma-glutamyl-phosphate reductase
MDSGKIRVGIVGATGYAGQELIRLIIGHPYAELSYLAATTDEGDVTAVLPQFQGAAVPSLEAYTKEQCKNACEAVFVALPSGVSGTVAAGLWDAGLRVVDLSGDLRLTSTDYALWYDREPVRDTYLHQSVYGLSEWNREAICAASLVANPGCYATATLLSLMPLARGGLLTENVVTVDAKSGVTGAGRSPKLANQLAELADNFFPYRVGRHQHTPEVEQALGADIKVVLTTQLLPIARGIYVSAYVPDVQASALPELRHLYHDAYAETPFVHLLSDGMVPQLKAVRGSNSCHIQLAVEERTNTLLIFAAIDNLQKGAAGQAVQNLNLMFGLDETAGLSVYGLAP